VLLLIVLLVAAIRLQHLDLPLERDEGEYAYAGQLIRDGQPPYGAIYNMKLPGVYLSYAAIMTFLGETARGIHLGLLLLNAATTILLFLLARELAGPVAALAAAAAFALLSLLQSVVGFWAHSEHFVIAFAVPGLLLLASGIRRGSVPLIMGSGLLLGTAVVMKQHGAFFLIAGAGWLIAWLLRRDDPGRSFRSLVAFGLAAALPFAAVCVWMAREGLFDRFWFWTVTYARQYVSHTTAAEALAHLWGYEANGRWYDGSVPRIFKDAPLAWLTILAGLVALQVRQTDIRRAEIAILTVCSIAALTPGLLFRDHYFLLLLPAAAILFGVSIDSLYHLFSRRQDASLAAAAVVTLFVVVVLGSTVIARRGYLFSWSDQQTLRATYGRSAFEAAPLLGEHIRRNSAPGERVAVIGSEPEIYFYSDRPAATGYVYTYPLMEAHPFALKMQRQMIAEIERARPRFVVFVNDPFSWLARPGSHHDILEWAQRYIGNGYRATAIADIGDTTIIRTGPAAEAHELRSDIWVAVLEREKQLQPDPPQR
jgi:4-amino-4-deoxy-L-arabinose transferase-like glycosyltransferase